MSFARCFLTTAALAAARYVPPPPPLLAPFRVSQTLGDHAVLQRGVSATVWGFAPLGTTVSAALDGAPVANARVDAQGVWRVALPAHPAGGPHALTFSCSGASQPPLALADVLFGDVFACGGQSNMAFTVAEALNASAEIQAANAYGAVIRHLTVPPQNSQNGTAVDLAAVVPWALASNTTVGELSAVCWFHGKRLVDTTPPGVAPVPVGLIADSVGGTAIELWSTVESRKQCDDPSLNPPSPSPPTDGSLFASMIAPLTTGPTALAGWLFFQGEANSPPYQHAPAWYACAFPAMVTSWRARFQQEFWFGFVMLAPFSPGPDGWEDIRESQLAALALPRVAFASAVDVGDPLSPEGPYHPRNKQAIGSRLADAARATLFGNASVVWRGPTLKGAAVTQAGGTGAGSTVSATATFDPATLAGGLQLVPNACPTDEGVPAAICSSFDFFVSRGSNPQPFAWRYLGPGFLAAGDDLGTVMGTVVDARAACDANPLCVGFTFTGNASDPGPGGAKMLLKSALNYFASPGWQAWGSDKDPRGVRLPATSAVLGADGISVTFSAATLRDGQVPLSAAYGWATWPLSVLRNGAGLPAVPWRVLAGNSSAVAAHLKGLR